MNRSENKYSSLKMSCSNVRGLNKSPKLGSKMAHIMTHLDSDIKIVVDAHMDEKTLGYLKKEYKLELAKYEIISNYSKERGIVVFTKKSCGFVTSNILLLDETDTLKFDLTSPDGTKYNIVAIYAPDGNNATYWTTLHKKLINGPRTKQILIGDFNVTLDPYLDRTNYFTDNHVKGREVINSWIEGEEYFDAFRYIYPTSSTYSWRWDGNGNHSSKDQKGRLDHCLVTPDLIDQTINVKYQYTSATDHASIIIEIETEAEAYGKGTFRAPPNIQNEKIYHQMAVEVIMDTILENKAVNNESIAFRKRQKARKELEKKYNQLKYITKEEQNDDYLANSEELKLNYAIAL